MIQVAMHLKTMGHNVFIASGEKHLALFRNETEGLSYINFPGFSPGYSRILPQYLSLLFKTPALLYHIISEHHKLKKIIKDYSVDIVISDNRFGLWNRKVTTAYVTHMPRIPFPKLFRFLEFIGIAMHRAIIKRYDFCFIPDLPGDKNLTGRLSHGLRLSKNFRFIGILSRFKFKTGSEKESKTYNTVILSGPEPQREMLRVRLIEILKDKEPETVFLEGKPEVEPSRLLYGNIIRYNHLPAAEMEAIIRESGGIICRSGYSTIMDLVRLNCSALLVPTPGQTEQEYLADYLTEKEFFTSVIQNKISADLEIPSKKALKNNEISAESSELFLKAIDELLEKHHKKR
jgi:UDP-N-acetylglucosamine transferase subunit ALG13